MNDIEKKQKRIETIVKVAGLTIAGFFFAPIAFLTIKGVISLLVVGATGIFAVNVGVPWFAISVANWRLKALKAAAAANPIETLENQYHEREQALIGIRNNIKEFYGVTQDMWNQIQEHDAKYPGKPSLFAEKYTQMKALLELRSAKYKKAQADLKAFAEIIDEKRMDWKIAQSTARASKLANVGEDFQSKLLQDTSLSTIQDGLNFAFAELQTSLLDEQPVTTTVSVAPPPGAKSLPLKAGSAPTLDLEFEEHENAFVKTTTKK